MNKMKLKKKKKHAKFNIIFTIFITIIIAVFYILKIFNSKAIPVFLEYSEIEVKRIASLVINNSIMNNIGTDVDLDDLFVLKTDNEGNVVSMDIKSSEVNKMLLKAGHILEKNFSYLENGEIEKLEVKNLNVNSKRKGIIYELPSGIIFNNLFINNLLPKIPVRLNFVNSVFSKITTETESFGINNAIFKVNIYVSSDVKIILPFASKNIEVSATIPIIIKIIEGKIPSYYFDSSNLTTNTN